MLTQGPAPDPKCELNITSFLTLPHPLHHPICAKDIIVTVLLLQVMGRGMGRFGCGSFMLGFGWGGQGVGIIFFLLFFCFCAAVVWLVYDSLLCLFNCSFFAFFVSGPFN